MSTHPESSEPGPITVTAQAPVSKRRLRSITTWLPGKVEPLPDAALTPLTRCPDCGHDIRAISTPNCSACGVNVVTAVRRNQSNAAARSETFDQYRRALILVVVAYGALTALLAFAGEPGDAAWFALRQGVFVPIAVALFATFSAAWFGFDQPFVVSILRLAAIIAFSDMVGFMLWWVPIMFVTQFGVAAAIVLGMLRWMDLEPHEAIITGIVLGTARYIVHLSLAYST